MFYVSSIKDNSVGVTDTYDNVEEFYTPSQIKEISSYTKIKGVSSKGIKKIDLGEALLTREIINEIDCEKELSFEVIDDSTELAKYKLLFGGKVINDNLMAIETGTNIKLVSTKIIMLGDSVPSNTGWGYIGLFTGTKFTKVDFHNTNTSNVESMHEMFMKCHTKSLDLSNFDTSNVENMTGMFINCHAKSLDLSNFDTSNVENMYGMFMNCHTKSLDLSNFDTSNVENMCGMFWNCHTKSLNLSSFNTSNVENMAHMFENCQATSLDLSSFDTSNVKSMVSMFTNYRGTIKSTDSRILKLYNNRDLS